MVQNNPDQFTALRKEDPVLISTNHLLLSIYQPLTGIWPTSQEKNRQMETKMQT